MPSPSTLSTFLRSTFFCSNLVALFLLIPAPGNAQAPKPKTTLTVKGYSGSAPVIQMNGKSYVEIESLARITNGSLSFQPGQVVYTITAAATGQPATLSPAPAETAQPAKVSKEFVRAGIETITVIEDWRTAIVQAVKNNSPVTPDWVDGYRRNAETKLALASSAVVTDADREALLLFRYDFTSMQSLSDKYLALRKDLTYVASDSLENDALNQKIQSCGRGLSALTAGSPFQDVTVCH